MFTFAACKQSNAVSSSSTGSAAAGGSEPAASGTSSGVAVSGSVSSAGASSNLPVTSEPAKNDKYTVKTVDYKYKENNKNYRATYPQLSKDGVDYTKVNDLLKSTALKTINSLGFKKESADTEVKVTSHIYCRDENFISVSFSENCDISSAANPTSSFRTVNFDLKNGKAVTAADMVVKNNDLYKAMENAVQKQMSKKNAAKFPASTIKSGLDSYCVYFKDDSMGFSLKVPHAVGDHVELIVKYADTAKIRTSNAAWSYFPIK